ncbi:MAG: hypothetical protein OEQ18_15785 [Gammaproteobacteria bacterium]|nr:hypothetical protein [Gammaproteobacteria bacterium]
MAKDKIEKVDIHPLIAAQERSGEATIEFRGFVGTGGDDVLRLYGDLGMSSYVDIPKDAVVYLEKDPSAETGKVRAFVSPDKKITEVWQNRVYANDSFFPATIMLTPELIRSLKGGWKPAGPRPVLPWVKCEKDFISTATRAGTLHSTDPTRAYMMASQALDLLRTCLEKIDPKYLKWFYGTDNVGEIVNQYASEYLPWIVEE